MSNFISFQSFFTEEHELYRESFRKFIEKEILPNVPQWENGTDLPKDIWKKAGNYGYLAPWLPEEYGGAGGDFLYSYIIIQESAYHRVNAPMFSLHSDIVIPYIFHYGSEEQKQKWLPEMASGECVGAIAMTEPAAGSDLKNIRCHARETDDGYILNGQKTFISNGLSADLILVVAKTSQKSSEQGISIFLVEGNNPGLERGKKLKKVGLHEQDTAELFFDNCLIPKENILGRRGKGFLYLMRQLQQERLTIAIGSLHGAERSLSDTIEYLKQRQAFGSPLAKKQYIQFKIAEMATEIEMAKAFVEKLVIKHMNHEKLVKEVSMAKYWLTEMLNRVVDTCLQFHGGYGYMMEYPIAKDFINARVQSIYGGANEIMKTLIAKELGL